ncbi:MAG: hypothetical protein LC624_10180 [Halobacteriales archaeon]|nr:hypothetical protein [Halobacteriales archaeon]
MPGKAARCASMLTLLLVVAAMTAAPPSLAQGPGSGGEPPPDGGNGTAGNRTGNETGGNATEGNVTADAGLDLGVEVTSDGPDLVAVNLTSDPARLNANVSATFTVRIANHGNASSNATTVRFAVDGALLGNASLPILDPARNASVSSPVWLAIEGNHTLDVTVDPGNASGQDANATRNDDATFAISVGPAGPRQADLVVLDVAPEDSQPQPGVNVTFKARIANLGDGPAGAFTVSFLVDEEILGNATVPHGLLPGEGVTVRSPGWVVAGGNHSISAFADPQDAIPEQNEGNNQLTLPFRASAALFAGADVRVGDVLIDPPQPQPGKLLNFTALVQNPGIAVAQTFAVLFLLDNDTLDRQLVHGLAANGTVELRVSWVATAGAHELVVQADPEGAVNDTSRLNNALPLDFTVPTLDERADLVLDLLTAPANVDVGDRIGFTAVVRNQGTWPSVGTVVKFLVDGSELGNARIGPLQPGDTARAASPPWNATRGLHVLTARVDPAHVVPEWDELNNTLTRNLTVPTIAGLDASLLPDPAVLKVRWQPLQPKEGETVVLEAVVGNAANGTAGSFRITFLLDGTEFDAARVPGVGSDQVHVLSKPWTAQPGQHTVGARLDLDNGLEREQGNDVAYAVLDVPSTGLFTSFGNASLLDLMLPVAAGAVLCLVVLRVLQKRGGKAEPPTPGP